ncbi:MAG: hypothetical protein NTX25_00640 [Proteobacteria bacterium]|nr:hypothetical protein [Pseudomonadota bacterium]
MNFVETPKKIVMLGSDARLTALYQNSALSLGHTLQSFANILEFGYLGRFREFDLAIVHEDLQSLTGLELAEHLDKLLPALPLILIVKNALQPAPRQALPSNIIKLIKDDMDPSKLMTEALQISIRPRNQHSKALELV